MVFAGKDKYAGEFKDNRFHGQGEHTFPDGESYSGEWRFGMQHGIGLKRWKDGTAYKGFYRQDARNGLGVCVYTDGTRYCGMWVNNKYDGVGKIDWPPRSKHPGSFTVMAGPNGEPEIVHGRSFVGNFLEGQKHGAGRHVFEDGSSYQGEFEAGMYHGQGTFLFANGDTYAGEWRQGAFHGAGQLWCGREGDLPAGQRREGYVGEFADGLRQGKGVLHFRNGGRFEGNFKAGARTGQGVHVYPDGHRVRGEWWQFRDARDELPRCVCPRASLVPWRHMATWLGCSVAASLSLLPCSLRVCVYSGTMLKYAVFSTQQNPRHFAAGAHDERGGHFQAHV